MAEEKNIDDDTGEAGEGSGSSKISMAPKKPPKKKSTKMLSVSIFSIEADHPNNSDLLLQSIPNCRLRSGIDAQKTVKDAKTGKAKIPVDRMMGLASFPRTRGMVITVDPSDCTYTITDPLNNDKETLRAIRDYAIEKGLGSSTLESIRGVDTQRGQLDPDRFKNLVRECLWLVESNEAKHVKGSLPTMEEVNGLPGNYLLNPGSRVTNTQPVFEKDWNDWLSRLTRSGD